MTIRRSTPEDFAQIMKIYEHARRFMAEHGNPNQWGPTNWPPADLIRSDIADGSSYVCVHEDRIVGTFFFCKGRDIEPAYRSIEGGAWLDDGPYAVIHRLAGDMGDIVFLEKVRIHKIDALGIPFMAQIFVKHTAGMYLLIGGNHGDRILRADITKHLFGADTGGASSYDNKSLHTHTSLTSMACLGQARTHAGPSSKWAQKSHLIIRFRSGEMAGTP